jgi:predicted transcriptional regulator
MSREEQSDAIVVSFDAQWHGPLNEKSFNLVLRKRIPQVSAFKWLYFHVNNPVSAICGRGLINRTFAITRSEAIRSRKALNLSVPEIESYIGKDATIGCYQLGHVELAPRPVSARELCTRIVYHPPQSFFIVSADAKEVIDEMAGFTRNARVGRKPATK